MITIFIYGLDQFVVGDLSKELTPKIAKIYAIDENEVNFVAPNCMVFHKGAEQTSWNVLVEVHAPMKVSVLQDQAAKVLIAGIKHVGIHVSVNFLYYSQDHRVQELNSEYDRYLEEQHHEDYEYEGNIEELEEGEGEDEIYTGDIFDEAIKHHHNH